MGMSRNDNHTLLLEKLAKCFIYCNFLFELDTVHNLAAIKIYLKFNIYVFPYMLKYIQCYILKNVDNKTIKFWSYIAFMIKR